MDTGNERLSDIPTPWFTVRQAHANDAVLANQARHDLVQRYGRLVYRYLLGALHDGDAADDLCQEWAVRFLSGAFGRADPSHGRFRDYLKRSLSNLVSSFQRRRCSCPAHAKASQIDALEAPPEHDEEWITAWREELMARAWAALEHLPTESTQHLFKVLHLRADHPELTSAQMAEELSARLGRSVTPT